MFFIEGNLSRKHIFQDRDNNEHVSVPRVPPITDETTSSKKRKEKRKLAFFR
jgi:hypothetical protein